MADQSGMRVDWRADELDAIVADYFAMLADELAGRPYVKSHHNAALRKIIDRTAGSIERKHMNISAVLIELGLPYIDGYKPFSNFQDALGGTIERYLLEHPDALYGGALLPSWTSLTGTAAAAKKPSSTDTHGLQVDETPPPPGAPRPPRPPGLERLVRKFDPVARDYRNRSLGKAGESLVVVHERNRLTMQGRPKLAEKVRWVADEDGDGAGYDVLSYSVDGEERLIEVKTTSGPRTTPFFLTRNELSLAHERPAHFRLYRVYEIGLRPRLFKLKPPLEAAVTLEPETWSARVGKAA